jgi:hypothetical protein
MHRLAPESLGPRLLDPEPLEGQESADLTQKIGPPPACLDERDPPGRPGQLEDQAGHPGPAADVEQGVGRGSEDRQPEQRVQDEVDDLLRLGPVAGEPADTIPARELAEVDARALREVTVDVEPGGRDAPCEAGPGVA